MSPTSFDWTTGVLAAPIPRRSVLAGVAAGALGALVGIGVEPRPALAESATGLDNDASRWQGWVENGTGTWDVRNVSKPSLDGRALRIAFKGDEPYVNIHAYSTLPPAPGASAFELYTSFYFGSSRSGGTPVQALEFCANKWQSGQRWEWALQWQQVGDGSSEQGRPPNWRVWTGSNWQDTGLTQPLAPNTWHTLTLAGHIVDGLVSYAWATCDGVAIPLGQTFAPAANPYGDYLSVAMQLDTNSGRDYVVVDGVGLVWI